ncbi:MAG: ATP phosphoribosyltransferase regulatory subunit [Actinobacteria bacterium]|nr:ATP phosphoribosyltransferase regulatory subunit [Actinomycetota bacterium]
MLPGEALWRESIKERVQDCFASWGYMPIETPTLEVLDVLQAGGGLGQTPLSLFDSDGRLLALRPDVTLPIARMVASRLSDEEGPFRFRYVEPVFREEESLRAQAREFTQLGIESIGLSGVYADVEVIALFVEALRATGLKEFTVAICTVGVLRALIEGANMDKDWNEAVLSAFHSSNLVEIDHLSAREGITSGFGSALARLPRIRGGRQAIVECKEMVESIGCPDGLDSLIKTWDLLEAVGVTDSVVVDFSVMSSFDYYTGLVIEAYAPGLGVSLGGGGRYDRMLEAYGRTASAAGFAFGLERVMAALAEQGSKVRAIAPDALVGGPDMRAVFIAAANMRKNGLRVCISATSDLVGEARRRGIGYAYEADPSGAVTELIGEEGRS